MSLQSRFDKMLKDTGVRTTVSTTSKPKKEEDLNGRFSRMLSDAQNSYKAKEEKKSAELPIMPRYIDRRTGTTSLPMPSSRKPKEDYDQYKKPLSMLSMGQLGAPAAIGLKQLSSWWNKAQAKALMNSKPTSYDATSSFDRVPTINFGEGEPTPQIKPIETTTAFSPRYFSRDVARSKGKDNAFVNSILKPAMASYHQQKESDLIGEMATQGVDDYGLIRYNERKAKDYAYEPNKSLVGRGIQGVSGVIGQQAANALSKEFLAAVVADMLGAGGYGTKAAFAKNSFDSQTGQLYKELVLQGVDPDTAIKAASVGGGINAALEFAQLDEIAKGAKTALGKGTQKAVQEMTEQGARAALKQGLKSWGKETLEEQLQENVSMLSEDWARRQSGMDGYSLKDYIERNKQTLPENAMTMGLLGLPGTVGSIGQANSLKTQNNANLGGIQKERSITKESDVMPNVVNPVERDRQEIAPFIPSEENTPNFNENYLRLDDKTVLSFDELEGVQRKNAQTFTKIADKLNFELEFFSGDPRQNGYYKDGKVQININSPRAMSSTFAHEAYHFLRMQDKNEKLNTFENFLLNNAGTLLQNESLDNAIQNKMAEYRQYGVDLTSYDAKEEVFADAVGRLFEDEKAIQHLYKTDRNLFQRVYDWIVHTISKIGKDADTKLLMDAQRKFVLAMQESSGVLRENEENSPMASYVGTDANGIRHYESNYRVKGIQPDEQTLLDNFKQQIQNVFNHANIEMDGALGKLKVYGDAYTVGKNQRSVNNLKNNPDRLLMMEHFEDLADILENATLVNFNYDPSGDGSVNPKNRYHRDVLYWHTFKSEVALNGNLYDVVFDVREKNTRDGFVYEIKVHDLKQKATSTVITGQAGVNKNLVASSTTSVSQGAQGVNTQNQNGSNSFGDGTTPPPMDIEYDIDNPSRQQKIRSVFETASESERVAPEIRENILKNIEDKAPSVMYDVISNKETIDKAKRILETQGVEAVEQAIEYKINNNQKLELEDLATLIGMSEHYSKVGDLQKSEQALANLAVVGTEVGRMTQILSLLKKQTPQGAMMTIERKLARINSRLKPNQQIELSDNARADILSSKTGTPNQLRAIENAEAEIYEKMPSTWWDKWNAWRYLSMLGNPRTHIKNIAGNIAFGIQRTQKDIFGAIAESMVSKVNPKMTRTKTIAPVDKNLKLIANHLFNEYSSDITGEGKENTNLNRRIFKNNLLESARKFNSAALEAEDAFFLQGHFKRSLAKFLKANGFKAEELATIRTDRQGKRFAQMKQLTGDKAKLLDKGIQYAIKEAQRATFRDPNQIASVMSMAKTRNKYVQAGIDSLFPFIKTPLNIMRRGYEYSPLGVIEGFRKIYKKAKGGQVSTTDIIDAFSASAAGTTTVFALGMALAQAGYVTGNEEEEEKSINDLENAQNYALQIGDYSFTLDWAAPLSLPFFLGVEAYNVIQGKSAAEGAVRLTDSLTKLSDPMINLSMLQGMNKTFNEVKYAKSNSEAMGNGAISLASGYVGQGVPTFGGQVARTIDDTRRTKYVDKNSFVPKMAQQFKNDVQAKIPFWSQSAPAYIDPFGREQSTGSLGFRALQNFVLPGFLNKKETNAVTEELRTLYEYTGDKTVLPKKAERQIDGKYGKKFTAEEYEAYNKTRGQKTEALLKELVANQGYKQLSEDERATMIKNSYEYAKALADNKHLGKPLENKFAEMQELEKGGMKYTDLATTNLFKKQFKEATEGDKVEAAKLNPFRNLSLKGKAREEYILSQMSDSAQRKYKHLKARGIADADTYFITYMVAKSQAGEDRTKEEKVRDLMRLGYSEGQAWSILTILNSTSKKWQ